MVYFGQELGEKGMDCEGFSGRDGRTSIFDYWNPTTVSSWYNDGKCNTSALSKEQQELRKIYNRILVICNEEASIRKGEFYDLMYVNYHNITFNPEKQYAYIRKYEKEMLLIVANFDQKDVDIAINIPMHAFEFLNIREGATLNFTDLCTGDTITRELSSSVPFRISVKAFSGVMMKCFLIE